MKPFTSIIVSCSLLTAGLHAETPMLVPITPALSPDGSELVFSWEDDLWKVSTDPSNTAPAERLTIHPGRELNPIYSPDGKNIFYNSNMEGSTQVFSMPIDKSSVSKQITFHSVSNTLEDLSADGKTVIYRSARDVAGRNPYRIYQAPINADKPERMIFDAYAMNTKVSPDGSKILTTREGADYYRTGYYGSQASQIWLYDVATKTFSQPVSDKFGCLSPLWMPDGSGFYYVCGKGGHFNLWKHDLTSTSSTQLTNHTDANVMYPVISKDGSTIIYRHLFHYHKFNTKTFTSEKLNLFHNLELKAIKTEKPINTAINKTNDADFSPSGLEIAFSAKGDIFAMDTVLREPIQLTDTPAHETNIYFGDKGKAIYYISDDGVKTSINKLTKSKSTQYWWETDATKESTLIKSEVNSTIASFSPSPDEKFIGYTTEDGRLIIYDLKTKKSRLIAQSWNTPSFMWSPNSEWITYSLQNNNFNSDIFIAPADGSQEAVNVSKHPDNEFAPSFSPDGKKLAFIGKRHGTSYDLYYVELTPTGSEKSDRDKKIEMAKNAMKKDPAYNTPAAKLKKVIKKLTPKPEETKKEKKDTPKPVKPTKPAAKPSAKPSPKPSPKPTPAAKEPVAEKTAPKPEPKAEPVLTPKANPKANPNVNVEPKPKADPDPDPDPAPKVQPKAKAPAKPKTTPAAPKAKPAEPKPAAKPKTADDPATIPAPKPATLEKKKDDKSKLVYDLDDIQKRIKYIPLNGMMPSQVYWKSDSKAILIHSKKAGKTTYAYDLKSKKPSKYIDASGTPIRYDKKGNLYWITNGVPGVIKGGKAVNYTFVAQTEFDPTEHQRYKFRLIWRTIRDGFYDEKLNGTNWNNILTKYEDAATKARSGRSFDRIVAMLLGELNASHCGYRGKNPSGWSKRVPWKEEMLHLGVKYNTQKDGWHITKVLSYSPASGKLSKLEKGEIITEINGTKVNHKTLEKEVLWGQIKDSVLLKVRDTKGKNRTVNLAPITYTAARNLVSADAISDNKAMVEELSKGKFGYIHIASMQWEEFKKFEQHLYENGAGKDGIIIDVRDNGGGFTTDHLLTALTQPRHAYTIPRNGGLGYPQDRFVYATWEKPIVVLCNQNSFSNAEIFSHAIKTLKRGKLVGVPTAGGVISAGSANILNEGSLRMPFRGWFLSTNGEDMELYGASPEPENLIWAKPGELETGIDRQIQKAVKVLANEVKTNQQAPIKPKYRNRR